MSIDALLQSLSRTNPRSWIRAGFLGLFLLSCWQLWRYYEWALGTGPFVERPEATSGFVPLGALMSISAWAKSGVFDPIMPASVIIMLAAVVLSVTLKRGFCGYVCPVGTITSAVAWLGRLFSGGRPRRVNKWVDRILLVPKYVVAGYIVFTIAMLPAEVGLSFQTLPYYATADLKILYGLLHPAWGYFALFGFVAAATLAIGTNTWCRYLCPLGALYGGLSSASVGTVGRDARYCTDCKACDKACGALIVVSTSTRAIRDPECDGCQECTRVCPAPRALDARVGGVKVPSLSWPLLVLTAWLVIVLAAVGTGHWQQGLADTTIAEYMRTMKLTHDF